MNYKLNYMCLTLGQGVDLCSALSQSLMCCSIGASGSQCFNTVGWAMWRAFGL